MTSFFQNNYTVQSVGIMFTYSLMLEQGLVDEVKWVKESGKWYCYRWGLSWDNTYDKKKYIIDIDDKEYGFNADGSLASGWFTDRSGNRCYAKSNVNPEKKRVPVVVVSSRGSSRVISGAWLSMFIKLE